MLERHNPGWPDAEYAIVLIGCYRKSPGELAERRQYQTGRFLPENGDTQAALAETSKPDDGMDVTADGKQAIRTD